MSDTPNRIVWTLMALLVTGGVALAEEAGDAFFDRQEVYEQPVRFPSIVVAMDGTVLAFAGQDGPARVRRSEDGGETWGPIIEIGGSSGLLGAAIVDEDSGDVMVWHQPSDEPPVLYRSEDHGRTWAEAEHTLEPDLLGGIGETHGSDSGITLQHGEHAGRLLMPARVYPPGTDNSGEYRGYIYNSAIYSDDNGRTWKTSAPFPILGTGEGTLAEISDGRVYYNSRKHMPGTNRRRVAWSEDGGATWEDERIEPALYDGGGYGRGYGCAAGLVRLPREWTDGREVLLFSNPDTQGGDRERITVWASLDGGETWPVKRLVYDGPGAYSSMAVGRDGTPSEGMVYLQFEGNADGQYGGQQVARFNLAWVLGGEEAGEE